MYWIWFLVIGAVAGWLAGLISQGRGFGLLGDIIIGIVGAFIGGFVFTLMGVQWGGTAGSLITATIGALLLLFIFRLAFRGTTV